MVKWPLEKRSAASRVAVKLNSRSVQWCTRSTRASMKALMMVGGVQAVSVAYLLARSFHCSASGSGSRLLEITGHWGARSRLIAVK